MTLAPLARKVFFQQQSVKKIPIHSPHNCNAGVPFSLKPASIDIVSDSALLCETAVCFLHIKEIPTNVCDLNAHNTLPEVGFEFNRQSGKRCVPETIPIVQASISVQKKKKTSGLSLMCRVVDKTYQCSARFQAFFRNCPMVQWRTPLLVSRHTRGCRVSDNEDLVWHP